MLDKGRNRTNYYVLNSNIDKFFEGKSPLKEAKIYAKENGFTHLKVISTTLRKEDKLYII